MDLQEILKKESVNEEDLRILTENINLLSKADLIRFGFATEVGSEESEPEVKSTKRVKKVL